MLDIIGETAGGIWKLLNDEGPLSMAAIVRKTKRSSAYAYMGIGWLAREDKLVFTKTKQGVRVSVSR